LNRYVRVGKITNKQRNTGYSSKNQDRTNKKRVGVRDSFEDEKTKKNLDGKAVASEKLQGFIERKLPAADIVIRTGKQTY